MSHQRWSLFFFILSLALFLARSPLLKATRLNLTASLENACGCNPQTESGVFIQGESLAIFHDQKTSPPNQQLPQSDSGKRPLESAILGKSTAGEENKWIEVDLSEQTLRAWEDDQLFMETSVSTGKWGRTPTGTFTIASKFRYIKMSGGNRELGTYYYLPNVPYVMFFGNQEISWSRGFSLHGTYWHNNFGTPMSHGCINLSVPDAEKLFAWAGPLLTDGKSSQAASQENPGTKVIIHE